MKISDFGSFDLRNPIPVFVWLKNCSIMLVSMETGGQSIFLGNHHFLGDITNSTGKYPGILIGSTSNIIYKEWGHEINALCTFL